MSAADPVEQIMAQALHGLLWLRLALSRLRQMLQQGTLLLFLAADLSMGL